LSEKPSYSRILRTRSFSSLWLAQLVSESGDAVFDVALLWLVLVTTGSAALVGVAQAAVLLPGVLVGPLAGVYADRRNRRNLMIASNLAQGAITGVLAVFYLAGALVFPVLVLFVLLLYTGAQFFRAANTAILPRIVRLSDLGAANGLFTLTTSANQLAGYAVGGAVIVAIGAGASITYDSLTFFVAAALLTLVARAYGHPRKDGVEEQAPRKSFIEDFREGLAYVRKSRFFVELMVFGVLVNFFGAGMGTLLAPYVQVQLHGTALVYGLSLSSFALGTIAGSVMVGKANFRGYVGKLLFGGVLGASVAIALLGLVANPVVAGVLLLSVGALLAAVNLPLQVLIQSKVPGEILGRAVTVLGAFVAAAQPIAAVVFGGLAQATSVGLIFTASGMFMIVISVALYVPFKELRGAAY
jgi:MFS family permease